MWKTNRTDFLIFYLFKNYVYSYSKKYESNAFIPDKENMKIKLYPLN